MSEKKGTALVTGASLGLGREFASLFAKDGHDVVLVARSEAKLEALAKELSSAHGVKTHVIAADLGKADAADAIRRATSKRDIAVDFLVNNAGFGSNGAFLDLDLAHEAEMIDVNIRSLVQLTHHFAKPMKERGFGRIMNIASTAAFQPGPYMATYYASKAFVVSFTQALAFELKGTGVSVTCHCPGATKTEFAARAGNDKSALFKRGSGVAEAKDVAVHAYHAMLGGEELAIHGAMNWMGVAGLRLITRNTARSIAAKLNRVD